MTTTERSGPPTNTLESRYFSPTFEGLCYSADGKVPLSSGDGTSSSLTKAELHAFADQLVVPPTNVVLYEHSTDVGPVGYLTRAWVTPEGRLMVAGTLYPRSVMSLSPEIRSLLSSGKITGFSIGWDVTPAGKRIVEVSIVAAPYFKDALFTYVRCSADACAGPLAADDDAGYECGLDARQAESRTMPATETDTTGSKPQAADADKSEAASSPVAMSVDSVLAAAEARASNNLEMASQEQRHLAEEFRLFCEQRQKTAADARNRMAAEIDEWRADVSACLGKDGLPTLLGVQAARASAATTGTGAGMSAADSEALAAKWSQHVCEAAASSDVGMTTYQYVASLRGRISELEGARAELETNLNRAMAVMETNDRSSELMARLTQKGSDPSLRSQYKAQTARASRRGLKRIAEDDDCDLAPVPKRAMASSSSGGGGNLHDSDPFLAAVLASPNGMSLTQEMIVSHNRSLSGEGRAATASGR